MGLGPFFVCRMDMHKEKTELQAILAPTIEAMGYELWGFVYVPQSRNSVLRVYIDSERGITVSDCERVSRQLSAVLDVEDPLPGTYTLEVSSPGLDRPLFTLDQFRRYLGAGVNIRVHTPIERRRHFKGTLQAVQGDDVIVRVEDVDYVLALDNISKASLLLDENLFKKGSN